MNQFPTLRRCVVLLLAMAAMPIASSSFAQDAGITLNWKDADIRIVVEAVSEATGKNFILDPRVTGKVNLLSAEPMSKEAFYEAFLSILQVHGYVAIESGNLTKILPDATARQFPTGSGSAGPDDMATQVIQVKNVGATQLVPILRPLIPQYGHMVAHAGSNMLIISDRAANLARMVSIIRRIDMASDEEIEVVTLQNASATEIVRIMTALTQTQRADGAPGTMSLVADSRTNSVLIGGDKSNRLRLRTLIAHLDTPLESGGDSQVRYLRYADAEELATKLQTHFTSLTDAGGQAGATTTLDHVSIWADPQTNAIVATAPPKMMRAMMQIVDQLDIRRAQVLVEAIIVEVIADEQNRLGVSWAIEGASSNTPIALTDFEDIPGVLDIATAAGGGAVDPSGLVRSGITVGLGRISDSGVSFAAILSALEGDADTNIISTPSIVTTDNEQATLNVGQEVPFVTGSFTNTGGAGAVNPFQTIDREQIGVKLSITPQINEGNSMVLEISQEISSIAQSAGAAVDLITNQRIVETTVIVDDGEILVLGGLIEDTLLESHQAVPVLGRIPFLGALFRSQKTEKRKTNLMIFIRAEIMRDSTETAFQTNSKYNMIREVQRGRENDDIQLMPGRSPPILPKLEDIQNDGSE
jgi:general secretion pathway protein D